ncbi:hypothetical protein, partial [Halorhodospira halochloris]|uniref:hypothetical protein n=1 Tax=Halorhodospira halochloris TaxID=1052 RepID=UPI001EE7E27D
MKQKTSSRDFSRSPQHVGAYWFLIAALATYLCVEFAFNAWLLDTAGVGFPDPAEIDRVETYGRLIASTGLSLVLYSLFVRSGFRVVSLKGYYAVLAILVTFSIASVVLGYLYSGGSFEKGQFAGDNLLADGSPFWGLFGLSGWFFLYLAWHARRRFAGAMFLLLALATGLAPNAYNIQYQAIQYYLVQSSSAEMRHHALSINWLREGYARDVVQIGDFRRPSDSEFADSELAVEEKVFLAFSGMLFLPGQESLLGQAERHESELIELIIEAYYRDNAQESYQQYRDLVQKVLEEVWPEYREAYKDYATRRNSILERVREHWDELSDRFPQRHEELMDKVNEARREHLEPVADSVKSRVESAAERIRDCGTPECVENEAEDLNRKLSRIRDISHAGDLQGIEWYEWCEPTHLATSRLLRQGELVLNPGSLGDYSSGHRLCPGNRDHVIELLKQVFNDYFRGESGGYDLQDYSYAEFLAHPQTARETLAYLRREGVDVDLSSDWRVDDRDTFMEQVSDALAEQIRNEWDQRTRERFGRSIKPTNDFEDFIQLEGVQDWMRDKMGTDGHDVTLRIGWSRSEFLDHWIGPVIQQEIREVQEQLLGREEYFADGQPYAEQGRNAVKALYIPVVGLSLSLFFGMLGWIKWLWTILDTFSITVFRSGPPPLWKVVQIGLGSVLLAATLALPFLVQTKFTQTSLYNYLRGEIYATQPLMGGAVDWYVRAQPVVYPIGKTLADSLGGADLSWLTPDGQRFGLGSDNPQGGQIAVPAANIRQEPSGQATRVEQLQLGTRLVIEDRQRDEDGYTWYKVVEPST